MRHYEIVIIFEASLDESVIRQITDRVNATIQAGDGVTGQVTRWGRRTFAYELAHRHEGYYLILEVAAEPGTVAEIDRILALSDEVLRHKVIRQPERVLSRRAAGRERVAAVTERIERVGADDGER